MSCPQIAPGLLLLSRAAPRCAVLNWVSSCRADSRTFSEVVADAKAAGYTEPDPRDDLAGMDVARKVTILAR